MPSLQREPENHSPIHSFSSFSCPPLLLSAINYQILNTVMEPQIKAHPTPTDVSFSSYLTPNKPNKITTLPPKEHLISKADDSELSVFDAQKYFNEGNQHDPVLSSSKRVSPIKEFSNFILGDSSSLQRFSSASSVDGYGPGYRTRSLASSSEASWNSQAGLLSSNARGTNLSNGKRGSKVIPRWLIFRPKCPCSGKKSVQVKEGPAEKEAVKPKMRVEARGVKVNVIPDPQERFLNTVRGLRPTPENNLHSENGGRHLLVSVPRKPFPDSSISSSTGFTFPILPPPPSMSPSSPSPSMRMRPWNSSQSSPASPNRTVLSPPLTDNPPRDSLEVFKPRSDEFLDSRKSQENPVHHQQLKFPVSLKSQMNMVADEGDELGSDASSDLFEIESISTQATYPISHQKRRESLDEAKPGTPSSKNYHIDEKRDQVLGRELVKDYSLSLPELERSPEV